MPQTQPATRSREAFFAFAGAVAFSIALKLCLDQIIWKFAGPITLVVTLGLLTVYLHRRGESWRALGLRRPGGWKSVLLVLPQAALGIVAILGTGVGVSAGRRLFRPIARFRGRSRPRLHGISTRRPRRRREFPLRNKRRV